MRCAILSQGADLMKGEDTNAVPPGLLDQAELTLLASNVAIALDASLRGRSFDAAPVRELAAVLARGLGQSVEEMPGAQAKLADPETTELLARAASTTQALTVSEIASGQALAQAFVTAARSDLSGLGREKLEELRDFSLRLSIAARSARSSALVGYPR
jgi:hypothetical protein